jgi:hypothetical protein
VVEALALEAMVVMVCNQALLELAPITQAVEVAHLIYHLALLLVVVKVVVVQAVVLEVLLLPFLVLPTQAAAVVVMDLTKMVTVVQVL